MSVPRRSETTSSEADVRHPVDELLRVIDGLGAAVCAVDAVTGDVLLTNALARERFGASRALRCCPAQPSVETFCPCAERDPSDCDTCEKPLACEFETAANGRHYWSVARPAVWSDGRRVCLQVTVDVTRRQAIEAENVQLAAAVQQAEEAILVTDPDGCAIYVNETFERLSGWRASDVLGQNPRIFKSGEHGPDFYADLWRTILAGRTWRGRMKNRRKDGSMFDVDVSISPVRDNTGTIRHFIAVQRDVTHEIEVQAVLRQSHKMQAITTLVGGLSHELNNLLQPILGHATDVRDTLSPDDPRREALEAVIRQAVRGAGLTRQLASFGRGRPGRDQDIDVAAVVRGVVDDVVATAPPAVRYRLDVESDDTRTRIDPDRIRELVANLCANAADAIPADGVVTVSVGIVTLEQPLPSVNRWLPAGEYVRIGVADDGVGIAPSEIERLFEPFFTRKGWDAASRHTGLGLATVYGIVQGYEGGIRVASRPGEGTRIEVYLPRGRHGDAIAGLPIRSSPLPAGHRATILVVDDEPDNLALARVILERRGYRVLTAPDGIEALAAYDREPERVDLVMLDVVMPRMDGAETFRCLRKRNASLAILFVTGHDAEGASRLVRDPEAEFLFKPYRPADLIERVGAALARAGVVTS